MKDEDILEKFELEKWRTFSIGSYKIPKKFVKKVGDFYKYYDTQSKRGGQIDNRVSFPSTENYKEALAKSEYLKKFSYLEEFPVVIANRPRWEFFNNGLDEDYMRKGCIFFDFFYPSLGLVVELDGKTYHSEKADRARDSYCRSELGLRVLRLESFGKDNERSWKKDIKRLEDTIKEIEDHGGSEFSYSYSSYLVQSWREEYKDEVKFIEAAENKYPSKFTSSDPIIIVNCDKSKKNIFNKVFLNRVNKIVKTLYKKEIAINFR